MSAVPTGECGYACMIFNLHLKVVRIPLVLNETEKQIFGLLRDCCRSDKRLSGLTLRVAGGWVRDKVRIYQLFLIIARPNLPLSMRRV